MKRSYATVLSLAAVLALGAAVSADAAVLNYEATINEAQEVPPSGSTATGSATITIDTDANTLTYSITFSGFSSAEIGAHIHGFAAPGVNAGVLHVLPAGSPKNGVWNYAEGQEADILNELTYINIHSEDFQGGEIRGQIVESQGVPVEAVSWGHLKSVIAF